MRKQPVVSLQRRKAVLHQTRASHGWTRHAPGTRAALWPAKGTSIGQTCADTRPLRRAALLSAFAGAWGCGCAGGGCTRRHVVPTQLVRPQLRGAMATLESLRAPVAARAAACSRAGCAERVAHASVSRLRAQGVRRARVAGPVAKERQNLVPGAPRTRRRTPGCGTAARRGSSGRRPRLRAVRARGSRRGAPGCASGTRQRGEDDADAHAQGRATGAAPADTVSHVRGARRCPPRRRVAAAQRNCRKSLGTVVLSLMRPALAQRRSCPSGRSSSRLLTWGDTRLRAKCGRTTTQRCAARACGARALPRRAHLSPEAGPQTALGRLAQPRRLRPRAAMRTRRGRSASRALQLRC